MRLHLRIENNDYYDIGLRGIATTTKWTRRFGEDQPQYLEDFIKVFGKEKIKIISYGSLEGDKEKILKLLE